MPTVVRVLNTASALVCTAGRSQPLSLTVTPLNARSLKATWTLNDTSVEDVIEAYLVTTFTEETGSSYEEQVNSSETEVTFSGLIPYSYDQASEGIVWRTYVQAVLSNGTVLTLTSNSVETVLPGE